MERVMTDHLSIQPPHTPFTIGPIKWGTDLTWRGHNGYLIFGSKYHLRWGYNHSFGSPNMERTSPETSMSLALRLRALTSLVVPHAMHEVPKESSKNALVWRVMALQEALNNTTDRHAILRKAAIQGMYLGTGSLT